MSYVPELPPIAADKLRSYLQNEFDKIAIELRDPGPYTLTLEKLYVAPVTPLDGMICYFDSGVKGTTGFYAYSDGSWSKL